MVSEFTASAATTADTQDVALARFAIPVAESAAAKPADSGSNAAAANATNNPYALLTQAFILQCDGYDESPLSN